MAFHAAPLITFPLLLAAGFRYMFGAHLDAGMQDAITAACTAAPLSSSETSSTIAPTTYFRTYTGIRSIDAHPSGPCSLIATFHLALDARDPSPKRFLAYLLGTGIPLILIPWVEAYRTRGTSSQKRDGGRDWWLLRYPTLWLLLTQAMTVGVTYQMYWPLLLLSRASTSHGKEETERKIRIPRVEAEALAFAVLIGAGVPSAAMVLTPDPMITWAWQFYPVYMAVLRSVYLRCRATARKESNKEKKRENNSSTDDERAGRRVLKIIYLTTFLLSAGVHLYTAWPYVSTGNFDDLHALLVPSFVSASQKLDGPTLIHSFFKWDYELGYVSTVLGLMFAAKSKAMAAGIAAWCALSSPFIGMGAAVTGVLAWRDLRG